MKAGKCDRCGTVVIRLWKMGHDKTIYICSNCHNIWKTKYVTKLDTLNLSWDERGVVWTKFFAEFMGKGKEIVQFT